MVDQAFGASGSQGSPQIAKALRAGQGWPRLSKAAGLTLAAAVVRVWQWKSRCGNCIQVRVWGYCLGLRIPPIGRACRYEILQQIL